MKEYSEFDSLKVDWEDWYFLYDTKAIEKAYKEEMSINKLSDMLIDEMKQEFVKQLMKENEEK